LDIALGMILDKLDELEIADRTYVVYTADHGAAGKNSPLAGGKGTVSEGGLRVSLLIRGPGIKPGGSSHARASGADLFPTFAELAHVTCPLPQGVEGGSLVPVLTGVSGAVKHPREESMVHLPHCDKDPGERRDLAAKMPDKAKELDARLGCRIAVGCLFLCAAGQNLKLIRRHDQHQRPPVVPLHVHLGPRPLCPDGNNGARGSGRDGIGIVEHGEQSYSVAGLRRKHGRLLRKK